MNKVIFLLLFLAICSYSFGQKTSRYGSAAFEIAISSAEIETAAGVEDDATVRFSPWFNFIMLRNIDRKHIGLFGGLGFHNVGLIYEDQNEKWKARNYTVGIPVGIKLGRMKGGFIFGGYEFEMPFHYKEKYFNGDSKERKTGAWFSDKVNPFTHAVIAGINFPKGFTIQAKYYLTEFFNPTYNNSHITDERDLRYPGNGLDETDPNFVPARNFLKTNIFYIGLTWSMFDRPKALSLSNSDDDDKEMIY